MPEMLHDHDDLTKPTSFGDSPTPITRESPQQRIAAVLQTYCTPRLKYDGVSAWEIAGKILAVQQGIVNCTHDPNSCKVAYCDFPACQRT